MGEEDGCNVEETVSSRTCGQQARVVVLAQRLFHHLADNAGCRQSGGGVSEQSRECVLISAGRMSIGNSFG